MLAAGSKIFISYTQSDRAWAEWIAWQLEDAGYEVILQAWNFGAGSNFVHKMHQAVEDADCTVAVLSPEYERSAFSFSEWAVAFAKDATGEERRLVPVRIEPFEPSGLFSTIVYIDLVDLAEEPAHDRLLTELRGAKKPGAAPVFPARRDRGRRFPGGLPARWNVPHRRNRYFTGRGKVLERLHRELNGGGAAALGQAIRGLGGIGKTQTAVEYAYRYHDEYAAVLWTRAETEAELVAGMVEIAAVLDLPEKDAQEQELAGQAVLRWLKENDSWLLVLDNADTPEMVASLLPTAPRGHILVTSRAQSFVALGMEPLKLETLSPDEARHFLMRRSLRESSTSEEALAVDELAKTLGYLPLALEQAGAFISVHTSRFVDYLASYQRRQLALLAKGKPQEYPESVATTWSLNIEQIKPPAATEILRVTAFWASEKIPVEILIEGAEHLGDTLSSALAGAAEDPLVLDELLRGLSRYSLIERDLDSRTLNVHRMLQAVVRGSLDAETERLWAQRSVKALKRAYPPVEFGNWPVCERLQAHARAAASVIGELSLSLEEAGSLLNEAGGYAWNRGRYAEAEPLYQRSVAIKEQALGPDHPSLATSLNNLALLFKAQGRYAEAESLYQRSVTIKEQALGSDHPSLATSLNNLALLYKTQGNYAEAEPLYQRAVAINEQALGPDHPSLATSLSNLANLYSDQGRYAEAEPLYLRDMAITEQALGPDHPSLATSLNNLATLYRDQGRYAEAEPLYLRDIAITEQALGPDHPSLATSLNNLATLYRSQNRYREAESLYQRSVAIKEQALGPDHPSLAASLNNLAILYRSQGRYSEAEPLCQRSISIYEQSLGPDHPSLATGLANYAALLQATGRDEEAAVLGARANAIRPQLPAESTGTPTRA